MKKAIQVFNDLFISTVPSQPPMNLAGYNTSSTSIAIRWGEIPSTFVHGYLLGHQISYEQISGEMDSSQTAVTVDTSPYDRNKSLSGLQVYTKYCVRLAGRTRIGIGKKSECKNITTDEESKKKVKWNGSFFFHLSPFFPLLSLLLHLSFSHQFTHPLTHSLPSICLGIYSPTHSQTDALRHHALILSFIYLFIHLFIPSFLTFQFLFHPYLLFSCT